MAVVVDNAVGAVVRYITTRFIIITAFVAFMFVFAIALVQQAAAVRTEFIGFCKDIVLGQAAAVVVVVV
jgi:hypothetical protein